MSRYKGYKSYKIAIRSYKRSDLIKKYTLNLLKKNKIPKSKIYIFVGQNEVQEYKKLNPGYNILVGGDKGTNYCNILLRKTFNKNDYIIQMDDDLRHLSEAKDKKTLVDYSLKKLIKKGYEEMVKNNATIWGVYPVYNPYFMMGKKLTTDLRFIIGRVFGFINDNIKTVDNCRDDYERTILRYKQDGAVIRFNNISADALTFKGKGGLAEKRTTKMMNDSVDYMLKTYPNCCKKKIYKNRKWNEIRLLPNPKV